MLSRVPSRFDLSVTAAVTLPKDRSKTIFDCTAHDSEKFPRGRPDRGGGQQCKVVRVLSYPIASPERYPDTPRRGKWVSFVSAFLKSPIIRGLRVPPWACPSGKDPKPPSVQLSLLFVNHSSFRTGLSREDPTRLPSDFKYTTRDIPPNGLLPSVVLQGRTLGFVVTAPARRWASHANRSFDRRIGQRPFCGKSRLPKRR